MIEKHLGETIDIHGGGRDLVFPHHENELAQSQCSHDGAQFVRYWMHNGYINIDGEKMSKSLGNFRLVRDLLDKFPGEVLRFAILSAQYRSELNFSADLLEQAHNTLNALYGALQSAADVPVVDDVVLASLPAYQALLDDLNTPVAIRELHVLAKNMTKAAGDEKSLLKSQLLKVASLVGLLQQDPEVWFQAGSEGDLSAEAIEAKIAERIAAKQAKDYALADQVRDELKAAGVSLQESREGVTWRRD